jgi:hypothetical protein
MPGVLVSRQKTHLSPFGVVLRQIPSAVTRKFSEDNDQWQRVE